MKRYVETNESGDGLTLAELRHFITVVESMSFPETVPLRARVKFGNSRGAKINEISIDNLDRPKENS
jgi:hypothetical protein